MRHWLSEQLGHDFIPAKALIDRIIPALNSDYSEKKLVPLNANWSILLHCGKMSLQRVSEEIPKEINIIWEWQKQSKLILDSSILEAKQAQMPLSYNAHAVYFDADLLPPKLIVRSRKNGDKFIPFGYDREVKISKILQNEKVRDKESTLILQDESGRIYWLFGIKRSNTAKVTDCTKQIVCFSIERKVD